MKVIPFQAWHLVALELQPEQAGTAVDLELGRELEHAGAAWTGVDGSTILFCAGLRRSSWSGQALGWAMFAPALGPSAMLAMTRRTRLEFARSGFRRIEALVRTDHANGHAWARLIGLEREGTLRAWGPDGLDHDIYARVQA